MASGFGRVRWDASLDLPTATVREAVKWESMTDSGPPSRIDVF